MQLILHQKLALAINWVDEIVRLTEAAHSAFCPIFERIKRAFSS